MATLSPLAIALQGLGFPALLVAMQGLVVIERSASQGGGGRTSISQRRPAQADYSLIPLAVFIITSGVLDDS